MSYFALRGFKRAHDRRARSVFAIVVACLCLLTVRADAQQVEKWGRYVVSIDNPTYSGNPFELEVDATFTHAGSGTTITLPGYYAGGDVWKVAFMPTLEGVWSYVTASADSDLDGEAGQLTATPSSLPGFLAADPANPRKWKFSDGDHIVPIALRIEFFVEDSTEQEFEDAADFLQVNNIHMMETRLTDEKELGDRTDYIFEGDWRDHEFDLANWDRLEQRMNVLTERGLGGHIFFYSDDAGKPEWSGQSSTEALVIRYYVARLAAYPVLLINTGTDISEFRSNSDIQWWGEQVRALDPYDHPISSRRGGGSGSDALNGRTFDSRGHRRAEIFSFRSYYDESNVPISMDDAWGENRGSHADKDHRPADIRRAFWKATAAGGLGGLVRGGGDGLPSTGFFSIKLVESDLESEQWLRHVNPFIKQELGQTFGRMNPADSLVSETGAFAIADAQRSKILYFQIGPNDRYDDGDETIGIELGGETGTWTGRWFDPRTAEFSSAGSYTGGNSYTVGTPSADDWVLLLARSDDDSPPSSVDNLAVSAKTSDSIAIQWSAASDPDSGISEYRISVDDSPVDVTENTAYTVSGLSASTTYEIGVTAINGAGLAGPESSISATTEAPPADTSGPSDVSNLTVSGTSVDSVSLSWEAASDPESGIAAYRVYVDGDFVDTSSDTSYVATGLAANTTYSLSVAAVNGAGLEGDSSSVSATTLAAPDSTPPGTVSALTIDNVTEDSMALSWNAADDPESGVTEYRIYRDGSAVDSVANTSYTATGLSASTSYQFEVAAVNGEGLEGNKTSVSGTTDAPPAGGGPIDEGDGDDGSDSGGSGSTSGVFLALLLLTVLLRRAISRSRAELPRVQQRTTAADRA